MKIIGQTSRVIVGTNVHRKVKISFRVHVSLKISTLNDIPIWQQFFTLRVMIYESNY